MNRELLRLARGRRGGTKRLVFHLPDGKNMLLDVFELFLDISGIFKPENAKLTSFFFNFGLF